jgi:hypothetical protein
MFVTNSDKFIGYFAVTPSKKFFSLFERAGIQNVLLSYHYIRKHLKDIPDLLNKIRDMGGLFMVDSGAFSFFNDSGFDPVKFDWTVYLIEYVDWLKDNKEFIFSASNLDVDHYVGHSVVDGWNKLYFEPLLKEINVVFVAHRVAGFSELDIVKKYCDKYDYIGVSEEFTNHVSMIYQIAKRTKTAVHGFAWTKPTILLDYPFFSVDSTSWVNYQKYGSTPVWDGRNFSQYDSKNKEIRQTLKIVCEKYDVDFKKFCTEQNEDGSHNDDEGLTFSLKTWLDVLNAIKDKCKIKSSFEIKDFLNKSFIFKPKIRSLNETIYSLSSSLADGMEILGTNKEVEVKSVNPVSIRPTIITINEFKQSHGNILRCNNCFVQDKCPMFQDNSTCAINFSPEEITNDPLTTIEYLIKIQLERVNKAVFVENMEGGVPNKTYTAEINTLSNLNLLRAELIQKSQQKGIVFKKTTEMALGDSVLDAEKSIIGRDTGLMGQLIELLKK